MISFTPYIILVIILALYSVFILYLNLSDTTLKDCKLKIVETINRKGEIKYVVYKKKYFLSCETSYEFDNYNEAFDFVVNNESNRLQQLDAEKSKKIVSQKTRLNIK